MKTNLPDEPDFTALAERLRGIEADLIHHSNLGGLARDAEALRRLLTGPGAQFVSTREHARTVAMHRAYAVETREAHRERLDAEIARADATLTQHARELAERLGERGWPASVSGRYRREGWGAAVHALERIARDGDR